LDLDDYNKEVEEGCHITSMAGTWMSIVEGFGGMRVRNEVLHFEPRIPKQWDRYAFKVNFRGSVIRVSVGADGNHFALESGAPLTIVVNNEKLDVASDN